MGKKNDLFSYEKILSSISEKEIYAHLTQPQIKQVSDVLIAQDLAEQINKAEIVRVSSDKKKVTSHKTGNILLNWGRLFNAIPNIVFAGASSASSNWLIPFAGLLIIKELFDLSKVNLEAHHAIILLVLWDSGKSKTYFSMGISDLLHETNNRLEKNNLEKLEEPEFEECLKLLLTMKSIERYGNRILLMETIYYELPPKSKDIK
ncbi:hypothetical protein [Roseivirga sp.]|uniref:hypothetical protein n=1 Tax=Roseivirga sp. TaxID=1964215 RepID=UPI003B51F53C